jgi:hypothetical protein
MVTLLAKNGLERIGEEVPPAHAASVDVTGLCGN